MLPCRNQAKDWSESDRVVYDQIKRQADCVIYTSDTYWPGCMHKRNRFLADHSYWCICYLNQPGGGTRYTVEYCLQKGVRVINLADRRQAVTANKRSLRALQKILREPIEALFNALSSVPSA